MIYEIKISKCFTLNLEMTQTTQIIDQPDFINDNVVIGVSCILIIVLGTSFVFVERIIVKQKNTKITRLERSYDLAESNDFGI